MPLHPVGRAHRGAHAAQGEQGVFDRGHGEEEQGRHQERAGRFARGLTRTPVAQGGREVEHAAGGRKPDQEGEGEGEGGEPVGRGGQVQVARRDPELDQQQRPQVHDGHAVGVKGRGGEAGREVVGHPEQADDHEGACSVASVPPLQGGVGGSGEGLAPQDRVGEGREGRRDLEAAEEQGGRQVEPERSVHVALAPPGERHQELHAEHRPKARQGEVHRGLGGGEQPGLQGPADDGPRGPAQRELPAPEVELAQGREGHGRAAQALGRVVHEGEEAVPEEPEEDQHLRQRPQATEAEGRAVVRHFRVEQPPAGEGGESQGGEAPGPAGRHEAARRPVVEPGAGGARAAGLVCGLSGGSGQGDGRRIAGARRASA